MEYSWYNSGDNDGGILGYTRRIVGCALKLSNYTPKLTPFCGKKT